MTSAWPVTPGLGGRLVIYRAVDPETGLDVGRNAIGELQAFGPGADVGADELKALAAGRLAKFKVPKHILFIDAEDIPLTPSGRPASSCWPNGQPQS